jgi:hypothetical protein
MRVRIALVGCVKSKRASASPARELYTSPLFRLLRQYAEAEADAWYVLSAERGLLHPDEIVAPYERTLNTMPKAERSRWAKRVGQRLLEVLPGGSEVLFLAGVRYREQLIPLLENAGFAVRVPLEGLSLGRQLQRLKRMNGVSRS